MSIFDGVALMGVLITLAVIPSTSVALVVTRSATLGLANGAAVAVGIVLGDMIFALLAIFGMTALSELMGVFFLIVKYAAGAYLIWFGLTLIKTRHHPSMVSLRSSSGGLIASFTAGFLITLGDVKAIFFYASLLPTFVEVSTLQGGNILGLLLMIAVAVGGVKLVYALVAQQVASVASSIPIAREAKLVSGGLMVGAGTYLMVRN